MLSSNCNTAKLTPPCLISSFEDFLAHNRACKSGVAVEFVDDYLLMPVPREAAICAVWGILAGSLRLVKLTCLECSAG